MDVYNILSVTDNKMNNIPNELLIYISIYASAKTRCRMMQVCSNWYDTLTSDKAIRQITNKPCKYESPIYRRYLHSTDDYRVYLRRKKSIANYRAICCAYILIALIMSIFILYINLSIDEGITNINYMRFNETCIYNRSRSQWWNNRYYNDAKCNDSVSISSYGIDRCFMFHHKHIFTPWQCLPDGIMYKNKRLDPNNEKYIHCTGKNNREYMVIGSIYQICNTTSISWYMTLIDKFDESINNIVCTTYKENIVLNHRCP